ncbi:MAG: hypothetical protein IPP46_18420 [Bacteroidetes bacterium]|nr:hypothetical protein [Bacteroidota bacterium]
MSIKDPGFVSYLNDHVNDSILFTIQDKCKKIISPALINSRIAALRDARETIVRSHFKNTDVAKRVKFSKTNSTIPFNGLSIYKIDYKGDLPEKLKQAYQEMNALDDESPRKKFKKVRDKTEDE